MGARQSIALWQRNHLQPYWRMPLLQLYNSRTGLYLSASTRQRKDCMLWNMTRSRIPSARSPSLPSPHLEWAMHSRLTVTVTL